MVLWINNTFMKSIFVSVFIDKINFMNRVRIDLKDGFDFPVACIQAAVDLTNEVARENNVSLAVCDYKIEYK